MNDIPFHEAANIFPMMTEKDFDALVEDIREHGLREKISLLDGKVIDGRNRYRACLLASCERRYEEIETDDPVAYVLSLNLHRRHLTPSQASMVAARAKGIYEDQAKERQVEGGKHKVVENLPQAEKGKARDKAGKAVGVSGRSVDHASRVLEKGVPELVKAVDEGRMAVSTAVRITNESPEVQNFEARHPRRRRQYGPVVGGSAKEAGQAAEIEVPSEPQATARPGVGVLRANEAIDALKRIPKNDALRKRGFQVVTDWIKANK